jgi:zinc D-Ala-D-Ala carboxypeptidase
MDHRSMLKIGVAVLLAAGLLAPGLASPTPAAADECYTWGRTLRRGMSGPDVRQLQIRVGGWSARHDVVRVDGDFGAKTEAAVRRFQRAYGLTVDGVAGPQTFRRIYRLQDADCTPIHFAYREFDDECHGGFWGGAVSATKVKRNLLRVMWRLEALRKKLGGTPIVITSGFRSYACNSGVSNSQHLYGTAADLQSGAGLCKVLFKARTSGFSGIIGPGSPDGDHENHVHVDIRLENNDDGISNGFYWPATSCD